MFWASEGLNELSEVRFEFPYILIGNLTMAFLTDHGAYSNPGTQVGSRLETLATQAKVGAQSLFHV